MIRHIVLIRFQPQVTEAQITDIFAALPKLAAKLPGIVALPQVDLKAPSRLNVAICTALPSTLPDGTLCKPMPTILTTRLLVASWWPMRRAGSTGFWSLI